jgi:minor extracellular serine protease Vpr
MKARKTVVASAVWLGLCLSGGAHATQAPEALVPLEPVQHSPSEAPVDETPQWWFVELASAPLADGGDPATLKAEKNTFRASAARAGLQLQERYAYDTLFNGLSVRVHPGQLGALQRLPGVKALYPVETYRLPETEEDLVPDLATALAMTGADIAQSQLGLDGTGIRVAIMDTGIDIDHPDLGGYGIPGAHNTPFPNSKIVAGYDFVGDDYSGSSGPAPQPGGRPDDCNGHGTHVAGIVAADGLVRGVAPKARLGAYRVFGCAGSTTADIMIAAMERAHADGMHVLNMSIGAAFQAWPQYPSAQAATRLVNQGVVVVASIGNSGTSGLYAAGAPGVGHKVIGVANFQNTHSFLPAFTLSPDDRLVGYNAATGAPAASSGTLPLARTGTTSSADDACSPLPPNSLQGKVALIRRGTCSFHIKALNAQDAGAAGVILYNNAAGALSPTVAGSPAITIPVGGISQADGHLIDSRLAAGPVALTWQLGGSFPLADGGLLSSSSSHGMTYELVLKPDLGGPGGSIYSTYPLEARPYASLSGTSMSAPHVAGAAALVLQARPHTPAQAMAAILQNSAQPKPWSGNPSLGLLDLVHRQGAGMVQVDKSVLATTRVEPGKLSLGESEQGPAAHTLTVRNEASHPVTYVPSFVNAVSTGANSYAITFSTSNASVAFDSAALTVPAGGSARLTATVTAPTGPVGGQYGGYILLTPEDGGQVVRVPFAGYVGDYQARQVLTPTASGFPWLARRSGTSYSRQAQGGTYSMADAENLPYFLVHFDHGARRARFEVFDADTGKSWHRALELEHVARNSTESAFFAYAWDGTTTSGNKSYTVPSGRYRVRLSVLKALGDSANPAHWETWDSPVITVARP